MKNKFALYIHIPYCIKKCNYCDFLSFPGCSSVDINRYLAALTEEIKCGLDFYSGYELSSIFIGGGTPSILENSQLDLIFDGLHKSISGEIEITMECNPGTVTKQKAAFWHAGGINRISMGLQSANDDELKMLGRIHTYEDFLRSWDIISEEGFCNRSIDLISGLPYQTVSNYSETLNRVLALKPEHISAYSLQLEEGTPFFETYGEDDLPDADTDRKMYELTDSKLSGQGYHRYEISNYARDGFESIHNKTYWQRGNYLGVGLGAASMMDNIRFSNTRNMVKYLECHTGFVSGDNMDTVSWESDNLGTVFRERYSDGPEKLDKKSQMEEYMFLGLRLIQGIDIDSFNSEFGTDFDTLFGKKVKKLIDEGFLSRQGNRLSLTKAGIDVSNIILAEFLL